MPRWITSAASDPGSRRCPLRTFVRARSMAPGGENGQNYHHKDACRWLRYGSERNKIWYGNAGRESRAIAHGIEFVDFICKAISHKQIPCRIKSQSAGIAKTLP